MDIIIILGLSATGKYVAKEASQFGLSTYGIDFKEGPGRYSKYFKRSFKISFDETIEMIQAMIGDDNQYFLLPTSDEWVEFVAKLDFSKLPNFKTSQAYTNGKYTILSDKAKLKKLCETLDINYPKSVQINLGDNKTIDISQLEYPLFVKPSNRSGYASLLKGKKGWLIQNLKEWNSFTQKEDLKHIDLLVQEVIQGPETNIYVLGTLANEGNFKNYWIGKKARQYPADFGSASLVIEDDNRELLEMSKKICSSVNYNGFFAIESKYCDKRNKTYIIEINTRPGLWFGATSSANKSFVIQWYSLISGKGFSPASLENHQYKVVWKYLYKDLFVRFLRRSENLRIPKNTIKSYAVWDNKDLLPFAYDVLNGLVKKIFR